MATRILSVSASRFMMALVIFASVFGAVEVSSNQEGRPQQEAPPAAGRDDVSKNAARPGSGSSVFVASSEDYRIGPSDVLDIKIEDAPELSGPRAVSENGLIDMHFLGRMMAKEKTPESLAADIAEALRKAEYLKNPRVVVTVTEYNSRSFYILGAVRNPGVYKIRGKADMLTLLVLAGGLQDDKHGSTAFIFRKKHDATDQKPETASTPPAENGKAKDDDEDLEVMSTNISGLMKGILEKNILLEPGDIVNIPQANVFFIGGEVNAPGSYGLKENTTLRQAISLARGMTFKAAPDRASIFREDPATGQQHEMKVNVKEVMSGKKPDMALKANDIIVIPDSRLKAVGGALLSAFGMATVNRGAVIR